MKLVTRPATTNNITKAIINYVLADGNFAFRVDNGAVYDPTTGRFRGKGKNYVAIADILCVLSPSGKFLSIEVKNKSTKDKATKKQIDFSNTVKSCGGYSLFVESYEHFLAVYKHIKTDMLWKVD